MEETTVGYDSGCAVLVKAEQPWPYMQLDATLGYSGEL